MGINEYSVNAYVSSSSKIRICAFVCYRQIVAVKAAASEQLYICIDCGYIYDEPTPFNELRNYQCPQCSSGKKR